ncbi:5'/3'-nucleotidase SurE [bacterium]|nr:5'/3'-nucleotidase SurE [bacterium]
MNILLTNDDGYRAEGIKVLEEYISKYGDVTIVAPENNQSTTSHSISLGKPLRCKRISSNTYSISGLPADCVNFAINSKKINKKFDIVISGINDGANVGDDINYSGTVGAAREGYLHGINSIAVSIGNKKNPKFEPIANLFSKIFYQIISAKIKKFFLNINFPNLKESDIKGIKFTCQGSRTYGHKIITKKDPRGYEYHWIGGNDLSYKSITGSDIDAIKSGFVSITPLKTNYTDHEFPRLNLKKL